MLLKRWEELPKGLQKLEVREYYDLLQKHKAELMTAVSGKRMEFGSPELL
ncbi:MAG: hypothetical protein HFG52_12770 [Lachnospiraceae bacterium]|nr:hypothetical protein [Lachnospiraceae bacterium]